MIVKKRLLIAVSVLATAGTFVAIPAIAEARPATHVLMAKSDSVFDGAMGGAIRGGIIGGVVGGVVGLIGWLSKKGKKDNNKPPEN